MEKNQIGLSRFSFFYHNWDLVWILRVNKFIIRVALLWNAVFTYIMGYQIESKYQLEA